MPEIPVYGDAYRPPEWYGPPQMVGGYVAGPMLISQSDRVVVLVRQVLAFPAGVEVEVEGHTRGSERAGPVSEPPDPSEYQRSLRFRVQFADGSQAVQDDEAGLRTGHGPTLLLRGTEGSWGGNGREDIRMTLWVWPLPPPGPFALMCSWPDKGLEAAAVVLDANAIRAAADEAQPWWPPSET